MRRTKHSRTQLHSRNIKLLMLFWTLAIMASLYGNLHSQQQSRDTSLRMQAVAVHGLEMEYRNWVIRNGGVYAQVSDQVQPSQWLSHVPERDVRTPSGKQLTLLNSSYVVRLVHEAMRTSGNTLRDHIASLRPINPANTADAWERKALEAFSRGESEAASLDVLGDGKTYYRYMKPMVTEESCLKCHARFGDKLGDIRGGVSVAIPVDTVMLAGRNERNAIIAGHGVVWGLGMLGLFVGGRKQQQAMRAVELGEETLRVNEERLHFATIAGNIGIWDWDIVNNELVWDESMYALYGIRQEDFGGAYDAWISTLHPGDREATDAEIQAALRGEREYAPEFRIVRPDGTIRKIKAASKTYYDDKGKPLRMVGTNIDITERRKAEEAGRAASQYARNLIESSLDPLVTISAEGKITDVNRATETVTGRTRAQLIGTDFSDYFTEPDKARAGYRQVFAKGFATDYSLALRHLDGHVTDVLYNASIYRGEAGEVLGVFAAARDVTELKRAEAVRTRLAAIVESSNDAVIGKDLNGIITSWNKGAEKIYGYTAAEIVGKPITVLAPPVRHAEIESFLEKIRGGETVVNYESDRIRKDGVMIYVSLTLSPILDASGTVTGISTIARDITERKNAEFVLRQSEEALKEAQRLAHVGSWYMDLATNQVVWSEVLYKMYGFDPSQPPPLYTESMKLFTPESWEKLSSAITRATETGISYELELEMVPKTGGLGWMLARGELVRDERGVPVRVRGVVMDITERKRAEAEINGLNRELEQRVNARTAELEAANKELEAFSFSVSHDLRTPLRAIDGFSQILLEDYERRLDAEGCRLLHVVRDNTRKMGALIDDILKFSRAGRAELSRAEIDMAALAREVYAELQSPVAAKNLRLEIEAIPTAQCDRAMMRQVFANLLSNALKFSHTREKPEIRVGSFIDGGETVYFVRDNGVGFDMQYADKLFGVFQRLHSVEEFEGTGIGLAIVKRIVARHGGRVWAEGKVNEGATVYFSMPSAASPQ